MLLTVDSSVLVAGVLEKENHHAACKSLMDKIANAKHFAIMPYSVLVEVAGAIKRRTESQELAESVCNDLQRMETISFLELTKQRSGEAAGLAMNFGLRGMDAFVMQVAKENDTFLVTLDKHMANTAKGIVKVLRAEDV